jgi:hypothetical protein
MEVGNHPVLFSELNGSGGKSEDGVVASTPKTIPLRVQEQRAALIGGEPVAQSHTDPAYAFHAADACGKLWTEQAGISCFVRHTPDRSQAQVNRCWSESSLLQVDSVSKNDGAIESKSRFRAVPVNKFIYRMIVRSLTAL